MKKKFVYLQNIPILMFMNSIVWNEINSFHHFFVYKTHWIDDDDDDQFHQFFFCSNEWMNEFFLSDDWNVFFILFFFTFFFWKLNFFFANGNEWRTMKIFKSWKVIITTVFFVVIHLNLLYIWCNVIFCFVFHHHHVDEFFFSNLIKPNITKMMNVWECVCVCNSYFINRVSKYKEIFFQNNKKPVKLNHFFLLFAPFNLHTHTRIYTVYNSSSDSIQNSKIFRFIYMMMMMIECSHEEEDMKKKTLTM